VKISEFRANSDDELQDKVTDLKKEAFNLRFQKASGQLRIQHASVKFVEILLELRLFY